MTFASRLAAGVASALLLTTPALIQVRSGAATPADTRSVGGLLDRALHAWSGFPAKASHRPLLLLEGYVLNPQDGFPDDASKEAFENGEIKAPASWPAAPSLSMGLPIISATTAFGRLTTPTTNTLGSPPPLETTNVELGSGLFSTDRGVRPLPAWFYSLSGIENPAAVLAVAPSDIYSAPTTTGGISPAQMSVTIASSMRLVATFAGAPSGTGPCTASYTLSVKESKQAVAVVVVAHMHEEGPVACAAVGVSRRAAATLKAPLGGRVVIDARTNGAMSAKPASADKASDS
jgi:hypothetical protein